MGHESPSQSQVCSEWEEGDSFYFGQLPFPHTRTYETLRNRRSERERVGSSQGVQISSRAFSEIDSWKPKFVSIAQGLFLLMGLTSIANAAAPPNPPSSLTAIVVSSTQINLAWQRSEEHTSELQ